ncbi:hypothetical protein JL720_6570 [Aureococcus anophagefferens]|nr:hypothetical protein JL720_6570 [Aureococcus anophagefferens]
MAARGVDVAAGDENRRTPLHVAAAAHTARSSRSCLRGNQIFNPTSMFLLSEGADVAARDRWGGTPLGDAAREGHDAVCALLRAEGARDDDVPDDTGASSGGARRGPRGHRRSGCGAGAASSPRGGRRGAGKLLEAAKRGDRDALRRLLDAAVDVNGADYDRRTALHLAAARRAQPRSRFLVDAARTSTPSTAGAARLRDAEDGRHASVVAFLVERGAARGRSKDFEGDRRHRQAPGRRGDVGGIRALLASGVDVNGGDYDKRTALHLAAAEGHADAVRFLIDESGHRRRRPLAGTPLRDAEDGNHLSVVALLRKHGAAETGRRPRASSAPTPSARSARPRATATGDAPRALGGSADVTAGDYDKRTALHLAAAEATSTRSASSSTAARTWTPSTAGTAAPLRGQGHRGRRRSPRRGAATPPSATPRRRSRSWEPGRDAEPAAHRQATKKHSMPVLP